MGKLSAIHADLTEAADQPPPMGHNQPPAPSPYEGLKVHVEDLMVEIAGWCDGSPIETQAQADTLSERLDQLRKAKAALEVARKDEAKPFDDGKAEVQARYKPLVARVELGESTTKAALAGWLVKVEEEKRALAEAARREAEAAQQAAAAAFASANLADLEAREHTEALIGAAKAAEKAAGRAEKDKASATGGARAVTLRSVWTPVLVDGVTAARHYWATNQPAIEAFVLTLAKQDVHAGKRQIPGFDVRESKVAV